MRGVRAIIIGICLAGLFPLHAKEPSPQWLQDLDSPSFHQREAAWERLNFNVQNPQKRQTLAHEAARYLETETPSFEVLCRLRKLFPEMSPPSGVAAEISPVVEQLLDDHFAVRQVAERQVRAQAQRPENLQPLLKALRNRLADPFLTLDDQTRLYRLENEVRGIWLEQGANGVEITETEATEAVRFLVKTAWDAATIASFASLEDNLNQPYLIAPGQSPLGDMNGLAGNTPSEKQLAYRGWRTSRELEDALACDATRPLVEKILAEDFHPTTPSGQKILHRLRLLSRPCIVSEYWLGGIHQTSQFLEIGRRQQISPNDRWTAFSQLTETSVHCDNGFNLAPGFHPLDTGIPHPRQNALFCLRNLTSPRQKLCYARQTSGDCGPRLATMTQKTLDHLPTSLADDALRQLLTQLDLSLVSRWIPTHLADIPQPARQPLIEVLLTCGTHEAIPPLLEQLQNQTLPPFGNSPTSSWNWGWLAVLSIAQRDPWDGLETCLETLLDQNVPLLPPDLERSPMESSHASPQTLTHTTSPTPTVAATAAAMLCQHRNLPMESFGLVPCPCETFPVLKMAAAFAEENAQKNFRKKFFPPSETPK
ncbi:MAG: hypothetical protein Q4D98_08260 [Planctomycetia bacterium]|nr:hypothetical protein [Planctomycetia bacterium]